LPFIDWSADYETGVAAIDRDHQGLFALINDLYNKIRSGSSEDSIGVTIEALVVYVEAHFEREETLMEICDYPGLDGHRAAHCKLTAQVMAYKRDFEASPENFDAAGFMGFVTNWLTNHILQDDMAYVPSIKGPMADPAEKS